MALQELTWEDRNVRSTLRAVRTAQPLTYGLTNYIAAHQSANFVLAVGASPAIGAIAFAAEHLASIAGGAWINLAALITDTPEQLVSVARAAAGSGTPWVLDPVVVGAGAPRIDDFARELLAIGPAVVRGNASEIIGLAGGAATSKGVDSTATPEEALEPAVALAASSGAIVAVSGEVDLITDGTRSVLIPGGHELLTRVTATGCGLGALVAAYLGSGLDPFDAAAGAHATLAEAAARAGRTARGTGSFVTALVDELSLLEA
ncbi:hydroxyethylthiazole kinase [Leucobacter weissii]|uniref:Hydroxyethylthiazole kinase n=1 Tax=Leucobacter weissii TaxID=1983706 RepID=A0A939MIT0_9MICO|nr:hydroxyethylthiazole kinase [Leucobacter weissii]MBO1901709.1 hydroxyethylthiazole kinase [Leucobacter weissii]